VRLIVNRVDRTMLSILDQTIDDVMDEAGLPLLGVVLEDPDVPMAAASGKSLAKYNRRSPAAQCFARIAKRIQGRPEPIKIR
jgi:septum site-determining protein MinD